MNEQTIFTVNNEDIGRLDERTAVDFFERLLWAEARRIGIEVSKINVSSQIHVPDGGVDATVDDVQIETGSGIIKNGKTSYQIKSGKSFSPWQKSEIRKELFGEGASLNKQSLGENIRACLCDGGTYILVCTRINLNHSQRSDAVDHIRECLKQCGYSNPAVDVWSQDTLRGFLEVFPSLALWITGRNNAKFQTHSSWSQDEDMRFQFVRGQSQNELIASIQNELRRNDDTVHVRVLGEPGIGKTKLALEATKVEDLSPLVIYCSAVQYRDSDLESQLLRDDNHFSTILVIDECDSDSRSYIWNKLRHRGARIKLITIYNDYEEKAGGITYHEIPPLDNQQISTIIQGHNIPKDQADRWAEFCGGSPMAAHAIAQNLLNNPEHLLRSPGTVNIWERYIVGRADQNSQEVKERRRVLRHIALFKRFGYERSVVREAKAIAQKVGIEWHKFQEIVNDLKKRKILQGEFTLYITPKVLHIKLWTEWWDIYGTGVDLEEFNQGLKRTKLIEWFYEMFQYAAESEAASRIVKELLGPNGPFQKSNYLQTNLGSRFFSALAEAAPEYALECLKKTVGNWDGNTLLNYTEGRSYIIWALEKIAIWEDRFVEAAQLLLTFGEVENEVLSNNASSVFVGLFSPATGKVAPTEASPARRFPVLKEAFEYGSKERRALALQACNAALRSGPFSRIGNAEYQGLRPEPKLWMPKTYGELWDAYRRVWLFLAEQLEYLPEDERKKGVDILLEHAGELGRIPDLGDMVVKTVKSIAKKRYVNEKQLIEAISQILYYDEPYGDDGLPDEIRQQFEKLKDELVGSDFHSMMQRYVGMDLLEDKFDKDYNHIDQVQPQIEKLAQQAVDSPSLLQSELYWLVTVEAKNGYRFGNELGKRDDGFDLLPTLLDAQRNARENVSVYFLGGYFHAIFDSDVAEWEKQLDALVADPTLNVEIPELTNCSSMTDRAGLRVLELATSGVINVNHFGIFVYGRTIESLSEEVFLKWIDFLLSATEKSSVSIVLHLYHRYYVFDNPGLTLPCDLTFRVLSHPVLFEESDRYRFDTMTDYYWVEIGKLFLRRYSRKSLELVEPILAHFGCKGSIVNVFSQTCSVLDQIMEQHREKVWKQVSKLLEDQTDFSRKDNIERWLREGGYSVREKRKGALTLIPLEKIWEWVDDDIENRAWYLASRLVPKTLSVEEWQASLARELLVRYGEREEVCSCLRSNYLTEGWSGPASLHYERKQQKLLCLKEGEDNEKVKRWIDEFVKGLKESIRHEKIDEERRF